MCGIAGVYEYASGDSANPETLREMLAAIVHRGPDDEGVHSDSTFAFGSRRLSIIDLPGGHQPIANEDGTIVVAFNGEIYNYREIRSQLRSRGHTLRSEGDTEVLVHLYEDFGDDCVQHLRGMFAFAIWDSRRRRLLVARDRLGIKPLYWNDDGQRLLFGSEIKSLLRHATLQPSLDHEALAAFMLLRYVPAPRTMFAGVRSLLPGHLLICDSDGVNTRRWWDLSFTAAEIPPSESEATARLRELLEDAVSSHLISDVPYGAFLSGGVDSSTIVALMSRRLGRPVSTFSVGYQGAGESMSELPYARLVARRYETDHHEVIIGADDFTSMAERVVWHLDQPIADNACLPNFMVSQLARRKVKMVLTGEGGDEVFGGYARYATERAVASLTTRVPAQGQDLLRALSQRYPGLSRWQVAVYSLTQRDESSRIAMYTQLMRPETRADLALGDLKGALDRAAPSGFFREPLARTDAKGRLHRMLYVDTQHWLPDYLLARGDKTSMAASLEARVPFLDHELVEYAATLPAKFKVRGIGLSRKYLLRRVATDLIPSEILSRSKKGFPVPISHWLRGGARDFAHDLLSPDVIRRRGLLRPESVAKLLNEHELKIADHGSVLWGLMSLELWHRLYLDRPPSRA